ncbi:uncharacterized protein LOC132270486 [Cornus florida]|uniref:uncharacterized protein LOC132270486 n=1 Tax=Cornus florida TaxID=4283 RepID=UPI0028A013EE|nr:uncharacterized protein LOC132270486 [Cornus florida]
MGKNVKWSWTSALIGAASATATTAIITCKPRDPKFHVISITLTSFKPNLAALDAEAELMLTVHVTNPNIVPIHYQSTEMSIFYAGSLIGSACVSAGSQPACSCQVLHLPAKLSGLGLAHHAAQFLADLRRREMALDATVDIEGAAKVLWWDHKFKVHVDSHIVVDPVFLDVVDQENKSEMDILIA